MPPKLTPLLPGIYTAGAAAGLLAQGATYATAAGAAAGTVTAGASFAATMATGAAALTGGLAASTAIGAAAVAAATVASAAIGAAVGSIASQVVGMATGNVDKFSWRAVGQLAFSAGITAGVGSALTAASATVGVLNNTAVGRMVTVGQEGSAMLRAGLGSAVSLAAQGKWSWREVGASTVSAGAGYYAGQAVSSAMSGVVDAINLSGSEVDPLAAKPGSTAALSSSELPDPDHQKFRQPAVTA